MKRLISLVLFSFCSGGLFAGDITDVARDTADILNLLEGSFPQQSTDIRAIQSFLENALIPSAGSGTVSPIWRNVQNSSDTLSSILYQLSPGNQSTLGTLLLESLARNQRVSVTNRLLLADPRFSVTNVVRIDDTWLREFLVGRSDGSNTDPPVFKTAGMASLAATDAKQSLQDFLSYTLGGFYYQGRTLTFDTAFANTGNAASETYLGSRYNIFSIWLAEALRRQLRNSGAASNFLSQISFDVRSGFGSVSNDLNSLYRSVYDFKDDFEFGGKSVAQIAWSNLIARNTFDAILVSNTIPSQAQISTAEGVVDDAENSLDDVEADMEARLASDTNRWSVSDYVSELTTDSVNNPWDGGEVVVDDLGDAVSSLFSVGNNNRSGSSLAFSTEVLLMGSNDLGLPRISFQIDDLVDRSLALSTSYDIFRLLWRVVGAAIKFLLVRQFVIWFTERRKH